MSIVLRNRFRKFYKGIRVNSSFIDLIGCVYENYLKWIEFNFDSNMSWENHGEWHVDHIIPISLFKEGTNAMIVNKLSNLRPMWKIDNIKKSNKLILDDEYKYLLNEMIFYLIV